MTEPSSEYPKRPSFGGNVADFLGTLREMDTGESYRDSLNPHGNPFEGKNIDEMLDYMESVAPNVSDLEILSARLDDFYGVKKGEELPEDISDTYKKAREKIGERLKAKSGSSDS